jgi:prepilin-type processing-associated H-X9-DG protein
MRSRRTKILTAVLVLLIIMSCLGLEAPLVFVVLPALYLVFGWIGFIVRVFPQITVNASGLAMAGIALAASALLAHVLGRWLWNGSHPDRPWRARWTVSFLLLIVVLFGAGIAMVGITHQTVWLARTPGPWFSHGRGRETANRVKCASNLRQIGQAILLYANDHDGQFPDTLQTLFKDEDLDLTPGVFVCPSANDVQATGATREEIARNLDEPNHMSYVYLGRGLTKASPKDTVVAYDREINHGRQGGNVLYADGHVDWQAGDFIRQLSTRPATRP